MSCHWSVLHSRKILLFTTPNCRCSIGSLCFPHCTDLSTRITGIYSCQQPPREMLRTCTTEWSIESNKTWLVQCSDWNQIPDSLLFIDFFSNFFDILVGTTCWRAPRMRMIFNAHFPSFEPHKPLKNLHTAQCFLLMGLLKHFVCFCGRFSETETKFKQIRCSVWSDITILQAELDSTWENWQHKPVQPSAVTSAWLLTREGCKYTHLAGEHSTMIRKSSPKPVRIFWVPHVTWPPWG